MIIHSFKKYFLTCLLCLILTENSLAGAREDGLKAYKQGHYAEAIRLWLPVAKADDTEIQFNLGIMYSEGRGISKNPDEALYWFKRAAEKGDAEHSGQRRPAVGRLALDPFRHHDLPLEEPVPVDQRQGHRLTGQPASRRQRGGERQHGRATVRGIRYIRCATGKARPCVR